MAYDKVLISILDQALERLPLISNDDFSSKLNPTKWSKKEILGHLIQITIISKGF